VVVPHDRRLKMHAVNDLRSILDAIAAGNQFDPAPATRTGRHWARKKIPVSSLLNGYRIGFHRLWDISAEVAGRQRIDYESLRGLTDRLSIAALRSQLITQRVPSMNHADAIDRLRALREEVATRPPSTSSLKRLA